MDSRYGKASDILKKVLKNLDPNRDFEDMRYNSISQRLGAIESSIQRNSKTTKEATPRSEQLAKERCQAVAKILWKQNPTFTTKELSEHPDINNEEITGGIFYTSRTLYEWIAEVDPRNPEAKVGRPRKAKEPK